MPAATARRSAYAGCRSDSAPSQMARFCPDLSAAAIARWPTLACAPATSDARCFGAVGAVEAGRVDSSEIRELAGRRRLEVRRDREQVVEARRIQERDLRATLGGLAHAVRQHRRFTAQVAADDQQGVELVDAGDRQASESGRGRVVGLVAEIRLAQAMVDVARAERARELRREIELFDGRGTARQASRVPRRRPSGPWPRSRAPLPS